VKKTTRSILVQLAVIGLVVGGRAAVAQMIPDGAEQPGGVDIHFGPALPVEPGPLGDAPIFADQPEPEPKPDAAVGQPAEVMPGLAETPFVAEESISFDGDAYGEAYGACATGPCCAVCGGGDCCPPTWYTHQEARIFARSWPTNIALALEDVPRTDTQGNFVVTPPFTVAEPRLSTRSVGFDVAAGYAMTLGRYLGRDARNRDRFLEFSYWGLSDWRETRAVTGERLTDTVTLAPNTVTFGSLNSEFPAAVGGFNRVDLQRISYYSDLNNFELNLRLRPRGRGNRLVLHPSGRWRQECRPGWQCSYLIGVRVMSIDENLTWHTEGAFEVNGAPFGNVTADYSVRTYNNLVGMQFGADLMHRTCKYSWGVRAKAGPYVNFSSQASRAVTNAAGDPFASIPIDFRTSATKDDAAFIGEVGFLATYSISPNLILRASWDMVWVGRLTLASEQITFVSDPPDAINTAGLNLYQGLSAGFTWLR
jgi:hypothetical protein